MTGEDVAEAESVEQSEATPSKAVDDRLIDELTGRSQAEVLQLAGEDGLLQQLTKRLLESALEGEDNKPSPQRPLQHQGADGEDDRRQGTAAPEDTGRHLMPCALPACREPVGRRCAT